MVKIFLKGNVGWTILSFGQNPLKGLYGLNHIVFWPKLSQKTIWVEPYCLFMKIFWKDNMGWTAYCLLVKTSNKDYIDWTVLSFDQNFPKRQCGLNHNVLKSKFSYKTIRVEPYCLLVKIFEKDNMGWTVLSFVQNFQ